MWNNTLLYSLMYKSHADRKDVKIEDIRNQVSDRELPTGINYL
jgi:hypothetical protein